VPGLRRETRINRSGTDVAIGAWWNAKGICFHSTKGNYHGICYLAAILVTQAFCAISPRPPTNKASRHDEADSERCHDEWL
jgi:hypothetical protein